MSWSLALKRQFFARSPAYGMTKKHTTETAMNFKLKALVAGVALGVSMSAMAADPIKIGVSGPFTGGSAPMGVSMRDGVRLAANEINAKGVVLGRKIELVERDDEAKNVRGVQVAQELINKEH